MRFIKYFVLFVGLSFFLISLYAEANNKVKVDVFSNEQSCWTCLKGIELITKLELKNIEVEITLYFCNESKELLNSLLVEYGLVINNFLDPLCLYPKHYNFTSLPAIIIKDSRDSVVLKEEWNYPQRYVQLLKKLDNDFVGNTRDTNFIEGLEFVKSTTLKNTSQEAIFSNSFSGFYNPNNNQYYGAVGKATKLSVFDSNGVNIDTIDLKQEGVVCFLPIAVQLGNDSNIIWSDFIPQTGERFFYSLNINTKIINRKLTSKKLLENLDSSYIDFTFTQIKHTNKFVVALGFDSNICLHNDSKLLLMIDENDNVSNYFGIADSILSYLKMSYFMWGGVSITADNNSNVYSLSPLSNKLMVYNKDGSYTGTICLEFDDGFLEKPIDLPKNVMYTKEMRNIYTNYKNLYKLFVLDNDIFVVNEIRVLNSEELKSKDKKYWLSHFDKNGKRIGNTIPLPINYQPISVYDNKILIQHLDSQTGKIFLHWYKILNV